MSRDEGRSVLFSWRFRTVVLVVGAMLALAAGAWILAVAPAGVVLIVAVLAAITWCVWLEHEEAPAANETPAAGTTLRVHKEAIRNP